MSLFKIVLCFGSLHCKSLTLSRMTCCSCAHRYYHELFLRGRPDLAKRIIRTRIKGNGMKAASSPNTEPNFYAMEHCYDGQDHPYKDEPEMVRSKPSEVSVTETEPSTLHKSEPEKVSSTSLSSLPKHSFSLQSLVANIVSPPTSPDQVRSGVITQVPSSISVPLPSCSSPVNDTMYDSDYALDEPHTGDAVFFEGHKFRYLDHLDLDDFMDVYTETACV
jgi:hypothetical protein